MKPIPGVGSPAEAIKRITAFMSTVLETLTEINQRLEHIEQALQKESELV